MISFLLVTEPNQWIMKPDIYKVLQNICYAIGTMFEQGTCRIGMQKKNQCVFSTM